MSPTPPLFHPAAVNIGPDAERRLNTGFSRNYAVPSERRGLAFGVGTARRGGVSEEEWPAIEYDDGYPIDEQFTALEDIPLDFGKAARWLMAELPRAAANMPCWCDVKEATDSLDRPCTLICFSTGGWSGAESIIGLIERRFDLRHMKLRWERGGHFTFELRPIHLNLKPAALLPT
jgi:hypothetical protein